MSTAKLSEDERIRALEAMVPKISQTLGILQRQLDELRAPGALMHPARPGTPYVPADDLALVEQTLSLLRSFYWRQTIPAQLKSAAADTFDVCFDITLADPAIMPGQRARIEDTPLGCVELLGYVIQNGSATFKICCVKRDDVEDCAADVDLIVHQAGLPDNIVYQERRTIVCRGRRFFFLA